MAALLQRFPPGVIILVATFSILCSCKKAAPQNVSGTIEADEAHVASRYGGRVESLFAHEGDSLRAGSVIAELNATELKARRDSAAAMLAEWVAGARPQEIAVARAELDSLETQLKLAKSERARAGELFAQKAISNTEWDQASNRAEVLEKSVAASKAHYDLVVAGTRPERLNPQARADLALIDSELAEMRVIAPADCILEVLSVKVGDVVPPNREVATLLMPQTIWVRVYVPETWLGFIQLGEKVKVRVDSFHNRDFEGQVEQIGRQAEFTPRNVQTVGERTKQVFRIKVKLEPRDELRPGMAADIDFPRVPKELR